MSRATWNAAMIAVLWRRDVGAFLRERSRIVGALLTPLLLWLAIGAGFGPSFAPPGGDGDYMRYFFPGVVVMLVLQVAISATMSVIEDRRQGFLQGVLVAPGSRSALVLGKSLGGATVALLHAALFLALAPVAGFAARSIDWAAALGHLALLALTLTGLGFLIAWALDSVAGYHVVMNLVLFPLWVLSGALFPTADLHPVMAVLVRWNPLAWMVAGLRRALDGGESALGSALAGGPAVEWLVALAAAIVSLAIACAAASRRAARI